MIACENSVHKVTYDFVEVSKIVKAGTTSKLQTNLLRTMNLQDMLAI